METTVCLHNSGSKSHPPAVELRLNAWTDTLPADGKSYVGISVTAFDAEGTPITDGEPIDMQNVKMGHWQRPVNYQNAVQRTSIFMHLIHPVQQPQKPLMGRSAHR